MNGGARFELDRFLSPPPELTDGWWGDSSTTTTVPRHTKHVPRHPTPPSGARTTGTRLIDTARAVVSHTPRLSNAREVHAVETRETDLDPPRLGRGTESHVDIHGARQTEFPRTLTGTDGGVKEAARSSSVEDQNNARKEGGGGIGPTRADEKGLARAWGLKDPSVARAMIKRAKRMRKFQNGEARRENMKNPDVRLDVFARNAGEHRTVRGASLTEVGCVVRSTQHGSKIH